MCSMSNMQSTLDSYRQGSSVIKDDIEKLGDLIHMDQTESSTPGHPLTYSGKNNKNKVFIINLFVDSISKKVFAEFLQSTGVEETLVEKNAMEIEAKTYGISITTFRSDNGIGKTAVFNADLLNHTNPSLIVVLVLTIKMELQKET